MATTRDVQERFRITVDLHETGIELERHRLRRMHPAASEKEINCRLGLWLQKRPESDLDSMMDGRGDGSWNPRSTRLLSALGDLGRTLGELRQPWALIGDLAVCAFAQPAFRNTIELAVASPNVVGATTLIHALVRRGYRMTQDDEQRRDSPRSIRLRSPDETPGSVEINLHSASCGIEAEIVSDAESIEIVPRLAVPVGRIGHLIALNVLSDAPECPEPGTRLRMLLQRVSDDELARARRAIALIAERGYHRGKDLEAELDAFIGRFGTAGMPRTV